jgi:hypothetical protein
VFKLQDLEGCIGCVHAGRDKFTLIPRCVRVCARAYVLQSVERIMSSRVYSICAMGPVHMVNETSVLVRISLSACVRGRRSGVCVCVPPRCWPTYEMLSAPTTLTLIVQAMQLIAAHRDVRVLPCALAAAVAAAAGSCRQPSTSGGCASTSWTRAWRTLSPSLSTAPLSGSAAASASLIRTVRSLLTCRCAGFVRLLGCGLSPGQGHIRIERLRCRGRLTVHGVPPDYFAPPVTKTYFTGSMDTAAQERLKAFYDATKRVEFLERATATNVNKKGELEVTLQPVGLVRRPSSVQEAKVRQPS